MFKRVALAAAAGAVLLSSRADASTYCYTIGGLSACASATVTTNAGRTTLSVAIQNLSNQTGNTVYTITSFGLYYLQPAPLPGGSLSSLQPVTGWSNGAGSALTTPGPTIGAGQSLKWIGGARTTAGLAWSLKGCGTLGPANIIDTCASPHTFVFNLQSGAQLDLSALNFAWRGQGWKLAAGGLIFDPNHPGPVESYKCYTTNADCQEIPPTVVTPEPATMALLALGLVGVGGAGFIRRRRQQQQSK